MSFHTIAYIANFNILCDSLNSREKIYAWIIELSSPETREAALLELSKKREVEKIPDQTIAFIIGKCLVLTFLIGRSLSIP